MAFHALAPKCPECKMELDILGLQVNSECHILMQLLCRGCGENSSARYSIILLKEWVDNCEFIENQKDGIAKSASEKATDDIFLRSFHINPDTPQGRLR
jgi:hypothetical protein